VARETADIPTGLGSVERERAARRVSRKVLDNFWHDIGYACSAPFLQLMNVGRYNDEAKLNRERIAKDRETQGRILRRLVA
jgi:hypothetical protein